MHQFELVKRRVDLGLAFVKGAMIDAGITPEVPGGLVNPQNLQEPYLVSGRQNIKRRSSLLDMCLHAKPKL